MRRSIHFSGSLLFFASVLVCGCKRAPEDTPAEIQRPIAPKEDPAKAQLAEVWTQLAKTKSPDEALVLLDLALTADPDSEPALAQAEKILRETTWNLPLGTIAHGLPIDQLGFHPPHSLWVTASTETYSTTMRWNLKNLEIEALLFPVSSARPRSLIFDPSYCFMIIERGATLLLCDAQTLKPIRDLGAIHPDFTPSAVVRFAENGPIFAHPTAAEDGSSVWILRAAETGEIIRKSEPKPDSAPPSLAAHIGHQELQILRADGSILRLPFSPARETSITPAPSPIKLLHAEFSQNGNQALTLVDLGNRLAPLYQTLTFSPETDGSLSESSLLARFPWDRGPNIWNGLLKSPERSPFAIEPRQMSLNSRPFAPLRTTSPLTAAVFAPDTAILGEENGAVSIHRLLPLPAIYPSPAKQPTVDFTALTQFSILVKALTGTVYDQATREFAKIPLENRIDAIDRCNFSDVLKMFPALDFSPLLDSFTVATPLTPAPEKLLPMWTRLAEADASRQSWFSILALSKPLAATAWYRDLSLALEGNHATDTHWDAASRLHEIFARGDETSILAAINDAGPNGSAAAAALAFALDSDRPEWIQACLATAKNLPPLLEKLAQSRIAQLQGRKVEALSGWAAPFPCISSLKKHEDWQGWEQADFAPALEKIHAAKQQELISIQMPMHATLAQRLAVYATLKKPETLAIIGHQSLAEACLLAAQAASAHPDESENAFLLSSRARELGAPAIPCLRVEAAALTALGAFPKAHTRWLELITEHPIEQHLPDDYAEAAYTAFESLQPEQAIEILTSGHRRFPADANFALRAGWIALLSGNPQQSLQFLKNGQRLGYPPEKSAQALALLATAAVQTEAMDEANAAYESLLAIAPLWANPETVATMNWPDEMKAAFSQLLSPQSPPMLDPQLMQDPLLEPMPGEP